MKKIIASFTMVAFIVFSLSCYSTKNIRLDSDADKENGKIKIFQVETKSGETIEFSKRQPGRIHNRSIEGRAVRVTGELDKAYIKKREEDKDRKILSFIVSIPLSEVEFLMIEETKFDLTITILCGLVITGFLLILSGMAKSAAPSGF